MRIGRRFFSVFLAGLLPAILLPAILLIVPPFIVLADGIQPEFEDGEVIAEEQNNDNTGGIPEDTNPPEADGEAVTEGEDAAVTGDIVLEGENPPGTGNGNIIPEQANYGFATPSTTLYNVNQPVVIDSQDAFDKWIENQNVDGNTYGGSIKLKANIEIKTTYVLSTPLSIDAGEYGVTLDGGYFYGDMSITGEGVKVPVLTVLSLGKFGAWESWVPFYNVTALGRGDEGGIAVSVEANNASSPNMLEGQGHIRSVGEGAVGVEFKNPVNAYFLSVSVEGKNSAAISAPAGSVMYYGKLKASGEGSKIVTGNNILLDTCKVSGNADGAYVLNRKIIALAGDWLYSPLLQNQDIWMSSAGTYSRGKQVPFLLSGDENYPAEKRSIFAAWDSDAFDNIDTSKPGKTYVPGMLHDIYKGLGLEDKFLLDIIVEVLEGGRPYILSMTFGKDKSTGRSYVYLQTHDWNGDWFEPKKGNFILERSDNEGEKWDDITDSADVPNGYNGIIYHYDKIDSPVWFRIQEIGGEYSNIAVVFGYEGESTGSLGGDRTGVDRDGENGGNSSSNKPTPTPEPEPELEPESTPEPESTTRPASSSRSASEPPLPSSSLPDAPPDTPVQVLAELTVPTPADDPPPTDKTPASPETGDPAAKPPDEWENDTTTAVSGKRLSMMMSADKKVTFIKNEVRLSFDASALEKLDIGDGQLFAVAVARLEQLKYTVSVTLDGKELSGLPCVVTLDGNKHDILVSGVYDFTPQPEVIPAQTHLSGHAEPAGGENVNNPADIEEKPSGLPPAAFVMLGIGCAAASAVFVKLRVKKYGR